VRGQGFRHSQLELWLRSRDFDRPNNVGLGQPTVQFLKKPPLIVRSFTRLLTLPEKHPAGPHLEEARLSTYPVHTSPLEYLFKAFPQYSTPMETIYPFPKPPWWTPSIRIDIANNKKEAKQHHDEMTHETDTIRFYTDGSGIEGHIGAAAYCPQTCATKQQYLGTDSTQNVYVAELYAVKLAIDMAQDLPTCYRKCVIYADSQPAIKATSSPSRQSGQSVICAVLESVDSLKSQQPDLEISLVWVPGHEDIPGNEKADEMAKEAAKSNGSCGNPFQHSPLKSMRNNVIKQASKSQWDSTWRRELKSSHLHRITNRVQAQPSSAIYNIAAGRRQRVNLARLRTGHCSLNQYLHRFGIEESPLCSCGNGAEETVEHFLIHCPLFDKERSKLMKKVGIGGMWVEKLLGYPKFIPFTLDFVEETGRFVF